MQVIHDISPLLGQAAQGQNTNEAQETGEIELAVFKWAFGGAPEERDGLEVHSIKGVPGLLYLSEFASTSVAQ